MTYWEALLPLHSAVTGTKDCCPQAWFVTIFVITGLTAQGMEEGGTTVGFFLLMMTNMSSIISVFVVALIARSDD